MRVVRIGVGKRWVEGIEGYSAVRGYAAWQEGRDRAIGKAFAEACKTADKVWLPWKVGKSCAHQLWKNRPRERTVKYGLYQQEDWRAMEASKLADEVLGKEGGFWLLIDEDLTMLCSTFS